MIESTNIKSIRSAIAACVMLTLWIALIIVASISHALGQERIVAVDAIGMTVSDMDQSIDFYSKVLSFEKVSDAEVWGTEYEHLEGVFGLRMRVVRMKLGEEAIVLT